MTFAGEGRADAYDLGRVIDDYGKADINVMDGRLPGLALSYNTRCT